MSDHYIHVPQGKRKRLLTEGKYCPENLLVSAGGLAVEEEKAVNFFDFDGTLLYAYTLEEARALTQLPPGPDWHGELQFYGWNWELAAVQTLTVPVDIGALYETKDQATILEVELTAEDLTVQLYFSQTAENGTTWDFGDGSDRETPVSAQDQSIVHQYAQPGRYRIRVYSNAGTYTLGHSTTGYNVFGNHAQQAVHTPILKKLHMGENSRMRQWAFARCNYLEQVTLNPVVTYNNVTTYALAYCTALVCIHFPNGWAPTETFAAAFNTSLRTVTFGDQLLYIMSNSLRGNFCLRRLRTTPNVDLSEGYQFYENKAMQDVPVFRATRSNLNAFSNCSSLRKVTLAETSTGIAANLFSGCQSLVEITLPASVTEIGAQAFSNCLLLKRIRFLPETPPTVANANAFGGIPASCVVEVPANSLEAYQAAANYGSLAGQMVGV